MDKFDNVSIYVIDLQKIIYFFPFLLEFIYTNVFMKIRKTDFINITRYEYMH